MRHFAIASALVLVASAALLTAAAGDDVATEDSPMLDGSWVPIEATLGGQPFPDEIRATMRLTMGDGRYTVAVGERLDHGTIALDDTTTPKHIDIAGTEGPNAGKTFLAIYELTGDTLRICYDLAGESRPTEFRSAPDTQQFLVTYRRAEPMTHTARGTFEVSLKPLAFEGADAGWRLGRMSIDKTIAGDLEATTKGQMLSAMTDTDGSAGYVAIERVDGTLDGRRGTFVLQHSGTMDRGRPSLTVTVVPDSGTGELVGLEGEFTIEIVDGTHRYEFTYRLPAGTAG